MKKNFYRPKCAEKRFCAGILRPEVKKLQSTDVYFFNPDLDEYFASLPPKTKSRIVSSGVQIATLGELKQCAEHLMAEYGEEREA